MPPLKFIKCGITGGNFMPTSWYNVIPEILSLIEKHKPRSILDIGIGFGKYGVLIRKC